jgi:hypothetical protein
MRRRVYRFLCECGNCLFGKTLVRVRVEDYRRSLLHSLLEKLKLALRTCVEVHQISC